jgi:DNA polymerase III epsilon subunit-like protein
MENQTKYWTYLVLDLEMTWLNPFQHWVIEVAAIVLDDFFEIVWDFHMDLLPPDNVIIDPTALEYNWFTLDRIALGKSYVEFCDYWDGFLDTYFHDWKKPIMVGQFIAADIAFLASVFANARREKLYEKLWNDIIDTKSIANQANAIARYNKMPLPFTSTSLSKPGGIADRLHITGYDAHTANGDIAATREALLKFLKFKK